MKEDYGEIILYLIVKMDLEKLYYKFERAQVGLGERNFGLFVSHAMERHRKNVNVKIFFDNIARKIIQNQEQRSSIEEVIANVGHLVEFFPKFHCECNFIERFWGEAKRIARMTCDYSFASFMKSINIPLI